VSAKKTSTKKTATKVAVKAKAARAPRATKAFIEKRAKAEPVVAAAKPAPGRLPKPAREAHHAKVEARAAERKADFSERMRLARAKKSGLHLEQVANGERTVSGKKIVKKAVKTTLAMQTANAPFIKGVDEVPKHLVGTQPRVIQAVGKGVRVLHSKTSDPNDPVVKDFVAKATSLAMPAIQQADLPAHTMAKSYVRSTGAGKGKRRGTTFQCTVSFTEEQMLQVTEGAKFRNVSLAEMIRSCVVEHLGRAIQPQS
jgi:hypothetical protein